MKEPLRILQLVNVRWFNATAWYGLSLSRLLQEAGQRVRVIALPGTESYAKAREMGLDLLPLDMNTANPVRLPLLMRNMTALLREFRPQVVNCHRGEGVLLWGLCKSAAHPFALIRTRGDQRPPKANAANRQLHSRLIDALIATNSRTAAQCREAFGLGPDRLFTLVGGVDRARFFPDPAGREAMRRAYGFSGTDRVVGLLGRFDPVKGQQQLIEALALVREAFNSGSSSLGNPGPLKLLLAGFSTVSSEESVKGWVAQNGLADCTVLTGKVEDVPALINAMDLGVIASQGSEAIARAAFEIMACGVPLVGTDVGVMPDLLSPKALVPAGNTKALAALLGQALGDAAFLASLREEQAVRMQTLSNECFLEQTLALYRSIVKRRSL